MTSASTASVQMIAVDRIAILNPRHRNKKVFKEIVTNIADIGLKRPITVSRIPSGGEPRYDLVCGQGRLEAFRILGQREIPAIVIDSDPEECLVKSLVENCARRQHRAIDLLREIGRLGERGYSEAEIARKTDLSSEFVRGVSRLLRNGEHRLLRAVDSGQIPVTTAVAIAESDDMGIQRALQQAYEQNLLRGRKLLAAKKIIERRRQQGKGYDTHTRRRGQVALSSDALIRAYKDDVDKKRSLVHRAQLTRDRLLFVAAALKTLFADENFVTLLRAEGLSTLPRNLAERITNGT